MVNVFLVATVSVTPAYCVSDPYSVVNLFVVHQSSLPYVG
jgi:hypothetical protein